MGKGGIRGTEDLLKQTSHVSGQREILNRWRLAAPDTSSKAEVVGKGCHLKQWKEWRVLKLAGLGFFFFSCS